MNRKRFLPTKPAWQFLWWKETEEPDGKTLHEKVYRGSFRSACDKMLAFIRRQSFNVLIDHEARAEHVSYRAKEHKEKYPNIYQIDHPLEEYIG